MSGSCWVELSQAHLRPLVCWDILSPAQTLYKRGEDALVRPSSCFLLTVCVPRGNWSSAVLLLQVMSQERGHRNVTRACVRTGQRLRV